MGRTPSPSLYWALLSFIAQIVKEEPISEDSPATADSEWQIPKHFQTSQKIQGFCNGAGVLHCLLRSKVSGRVRSVLVKINVTGSKVRNLHILILQIYFSEISERVIALKWHALAELFVQNKQASTNQ